MSTLLDPNDSSAIIELFPLTFSEKLDEAKAAAATIHKLVTGTPLTEFTKLERALRARSPYSDENVYQWYQLYPAKMDLLERFGDASVSLLAVASFHPNGYVREEAVKQLSLLPTDAVVPFLILRLNDWVYEVRDAAVKAIYSRLRPEYTEAFIAGFSLVSRLEQARRADHREMLARVNQLLLSDECRADLLASLKSEDRAARRTSFKLALTLNGADLKQVAELGMADEDTAIRSWTAQRIASAFDGPTLESFLARMKDDRFMPMRRAALRTIVKLNSPHVIEELRIALLDPHASMREEARYHWTRTQATDVADFYRQQLVDANGPVLYSAISGLGETGRVPDDQVLVPYTSHESSKIRRAALKALAALRPEAHVEIFMKALADELRSTSREALKALVRKTSLLNAARVWEVFASSNHVHVKRNALALLEKFSKWESIGYLLSALCESDEELISRNRIAISSWLGEFNRSFSSPAPEQIKRFKDALERCGTVLDDETRQRLQFTLVGF